VPSLGKASETRRSVTAPGRSRTITVKSGERQHSLNDAAELITAASAP
jgi:hypothetical protein